jgi:hypothetical protein
MFIMLARLFPKTAGNADYRGWRAAIWLMAPVVLLRAAQGINVVLDTSEVAKNADGIPIDTYGAAGSETATALFALSGIAYLLLAVLGIVVLVRYRALLAFLYLMMLLDVGIAKIVIAMHPIARAGAATVGGFALGPAINDAILAALALGLVLSLLARKEAP